MDLATLKVEVKAWEKAFKAREQRAPTKDDIKADQHGIGEKYALYRKLSKEQSASRDTSSQAGPSRLPRTQPEPSTPTPHSRRSSVSRSGPAKKLEFGDELKPSKRPASPSPIITPKRPRPSYSGPIHDPNPVNPFSSPVRNGSLFVPQSIQATGESPFLHANSPRKLKQLLEANSLKKMRDRNGDDAITPRSKARLRLTGDFVTPVKDKAPMRKRGQGNMNGKLAMQEEVDSEEEFGPSPMKPETTRTFTELLQAADDPPKSRGAPRAAKKSEDKVKSASIMSFFSKPVNSQKVRPTKAEIPEPVDEIVAPEEPILEDIIAADSPNDRLPTPPLAHPSSQDSPSYEARPKVVEFSDEEVDEWDPEAGNVKRKVVITGTRRQVKRRGSLSSVSQESDAETPETPYIYETEDPSIDALLVSGTTSTTLSASPPANPNLPILSLLSLKSPAKSDSRLTDLRVKAIFNPLDAKRLKAVQKGQDVYISGEGVEEEDVLDRYGSTLGEEAGEEEEGDDDWEEECEGWKRTQVEEDW